MMAAMRRLVVIVLIWLGGMIAGRGMERFVVGRPTHFYVLPGKQPVTNAVPDELHVELVDGKAIIMKRLTQGESFHGFGERFDAWNQRGRIIETWARDMAQGGPHSSYFAVPFFISSAGYGLFVNCTGRVRFDCGATKPDELRVEVPEAGVEVFYFRGTPREIAEEYARLVGCPQPRPGWVFEPWISRNSYVSAYEVDRVIDQMEAHGLRAGVVVLEAWAEGLQNFRFEERRYPHPRKWIARLHHRGYHVVLWETPSIWTNATTYAAAQTNGFLVLNADGSEYVTDWLANGREIDFRQPAARVWWTKLHEPLVAMGVDGFKADGGERMPDEWFHNQEPFVYQRAVLDAFAVGHRQGITFARSADPLCAGTATFWAGDQHSSWQDFRTVVRAGLSAAISGFPFWGHDIGGYAGVPTKKLYIRWLELGAFSPIMQWHGMTPREPWYYDDETVDIARYYLDLRWRLKPYLLKQNAPLWRPLFWEFPDDPRAWEVDDEFLLGDDLLVAPVLTEADGRTVYLPAGKWVDAWTETNYTGPTNLSYQADLTVIPVFTRNGWQLSLPPRPARPGITLIGPTNERGVVPAIRFLRGQQSEQIQLQLRHEVEVTVNVPPGFEVLPARRQRGSRVTFEVVIPANLPVGSYRVIARTKDGSLPVTLVQSPVWPQPVREDGYVDLGNYSETQATFESPHGGSARFYLGSGDGMTVWLNGAQVFDKQVYRSLERDEDAVEVRLLAGKNTVRVRVTHPPAGIGANGFYLRMEQEGE